MRISNIKSNHMINTILNRKIIAVYINTEGYIMYFKYHMPMICDKRKLYKFFKVNYNG